MKMFKPKTVWHKRFVLHFPLQKVHKYTSQHIPAEICAECNLAGGKPRKNGKTSRILRNDLKIKEPFKYFNKGFVRTRTFDILKNISDFT